MSLPDLSGSSACVNPVNVVNTPVALLMWADNDCDGDVDVRDGQWLLTALLGSPIAQTEPCPNAGDPDSMIPLP